MTAGEYLKKYQSAQGRANRLKTKCEDLTDKYGDAAGSTDYIGVRRAGINKPTERKVEKAQAMLEKWRVAQLEALEIRQNIYALLQALPCHEADIMVRRYVWLEIWEQIERETGCTHGNVFRIHRRALQLVQELIDAGAVEEIEADYGGFFDKYVNTWGKCCCED